ncbi:MAG TPA: site-specific integrase, partial [Phycisphaerales bacterium]|nr:site-specific integrase [Phycisphaerales bacterium]
MESLAQQVARRWRQEGEEIRLGVRPPPPPKQSEETLAEMIAEFVAARRRDPARITERHILETERRLQRLAAVARWTRLAEITPDGFLRALELLPGAGEFTQATRNAYRAAWRALTRWAHRTGRGANDPLTELRKWQVSGHRSFRRRPFTRAELATLVVRTRLSVLSRMDMDGPDRAMLYLLAVATGFRLGELTSLTRRAFALEAATPSVELSAAAAKDGRPRVQALVPRGLPELGVVVRELRDWLASRAMDDRLWPRLEDAGGMLRADLRDAGVEIALAPGERVDFHALRGTLGRWLADAGVGIAHAQRILRHSSPSLTADHYTHLQTEDLAAVGGEASILDSAAATPSEALESAAEHHTEADPVSGHLAQNLRALERPSEALSGAERREDPSTMTTIDSTSIDVPGAAAACGADPEAPGDFGRLSEAPGDDTEGNASSRTRTLNPLIKSQL